MPDAPLIYAGDTNFNNIATIDVDAILNAKYKKIGQFAIPDPATPLIIIVTANPSDIDNTLGNEFLVAGINNIASLGGGYENEDLIEWIGIIAQFNNNWKQIVLSGTIAVLMDQFFTQVRADGHGHHFVPKSVSGDLFRDKKISNDVYKFFMTHTIDPEFYDHVADTWKGITHIEYTKSIKEILDAYMSKCGGTITVEQATEFLRWAESGVVDEEEIVLKKVVESHGEAAQKIAAWRSGFMASCGIAEEVKDKLTQKEARQLAKVLVNGEEYNTLSPSAQTLYKSLVAKYDGVKNVSVRLAAKGLSKILPKVLPLVGPIIFTITAKNAYANSTKPAGRAAFDAADTAVREAFFIDLIESAARPMYRKIDSVFKDLYDSSKDGPVRGKQRKVIQDFNNNKV
jgi:hypothetical protein